MNPLIAPPASSAAAQRVMRGNRGRDTLPELALRQELHRRGLRYRLHRPVIEGLRFRPDVVFPRARVVVEVMGCFWHRCPQCSIADPRTHREYWRAKLDRNVARDRRNAAALTADGWTLVVVWEHEDPVMAADRVEDVVRPRVAS
jgi:DNA mismatch endonuclease (patch repair protein)